MRLLSVRLGPQVIFLRSLTVGIFWKLVDSIYNPIHFVLVTACNAVIFAAYKIVPSELARLPVRPFRLASLTQRDAVRLRRSPLRAALFALYCGAGCVLASSPACCGEENGPPEQTPGEVTAARP